MIQLLRYIKMRIRHSRGSSKVADVLMELDDDMDALERLSRGREIVKHWREKTRNCKASWENFGDLLCQYRQYCAYHNERPENVWFREVFREY